MTMQKRIQDFSNGMGTPTQIGSDQPIIRTNFPIGPGVAACRPNLYYVDLPLQYDPDN